MTSPDLLEALRSGAVLAEDELVRRGDVLRVLRSLGSQDADLALYGAEDNARAREYGEAAMTRACCAVAIMPASPDHTAAVVALRKERDEQARLYQAVHLDYVAAEYKADAAEAERDALRAVLSGLSSFLGAGLGGDTTTAEQFDRRIREGIEITYAPMVEAWRKEMAR